MCKRNTPFLYKNHFLAISHANENLPDFFANAHTKHWYPNLSILAHNAMLPYYAALYLVTIGVMETSNSTCNSRCVKFQMNTPDRSACCGFCGITCFKRKQSKSEKFEEFVIKKGIDVGKCMELIVDSWCMVNILPTVASSELPSYRVPPKKRTPGDIAMYYFITKWARKNSFT